MFKSSEKCPDSVYKILIKLFILEEAQTLK